LRRQTAAGASRLAGSGRGLRLDPFRLPVRFTAEDAAADGRVRTVELDRERVRLDRTVRGIRMRLNLPVTDYLGVAVRLLRRPAGQGAIALVLEHRDAALSVPLQLVDDTDHIVADWQLWARVLRRPLLVAERDGRLRAPFPTIGLCHLGAVGSRRLRRTPLRTRRPRIFRRRVRAQRPAEAIVHRGEREIIAPE
jgi:hypothetical protein